MRNTLSRTFRRIGRNYELYLFLLPALLYFLIFCYGPMYGVQIAFKDFRAGMALNISDVLSTGRISGCCCATRCF